MALSTVDQHACGRFPLGHSIQDHLDTERAALIAEWAAAKRSAPKAPSARADRWMLVRAAGLGLALAGTIAFGVSRLHAEEAAAACPPAGSDAAAATGAAECR